VSRHYFFGHGINRQPWAAGAVTDHDGNGGDRQQFFHRHHALVPPIRTSLAEVNWLVSQKTQRHKHICTKSLWLQAAYLTPILKDVLTPGPYSLASAIATFSASVHSTDIEVAGAPHVQPETVRQGNICERTADAQKN
jgi:hypothetical protein